MRGTLAIVFSMPDTRGLPTSSTGAPMSASLLPPLPYPIRTACPPGACSCAREQLLADPAADLRVLRLTRDEEKRLIARIEAVRSWDELQRLGGKLHDQLGIDLSIRPAAAEVRTVRGLAIALAERPGLCRKLRQSIPAAVRRCLDRHPDIVYALLNAPGLFAAADPSA
jgi:hypothetical protein